MRLSRRRGRKGRRPIAHTILRFTSLLDILATLLMFVLKCYAGGAETAIPPASVSLPSSNADGSVATSLTVAINQDDILVGNERVASVREALASNDMSIAPLDTRLQQVWKQLDEIAHERGKDQAEARVVTIQGDKQIEFRLLQKVMYTLNQNGFEDIALAVMKTT